MANLRETGINLQNRWNIEEFGDCALICGEQRIKLHQAFVCPQSRVLAAAFNSNMQEGRTKEMKCEFDVEAVLAMRDYMYCGVYGPPPNFSDVITTLPLKGCKHAWTLKYNGSPASTTPAGSSKSTSKSTTGDHAVADSTTDDTRTTQQYHDFSRALLFYANVSIVADYYDVGDLVKSTVEKIKALLDHPQCPIEAFCDLLEITAYCRGDKELRHLIVNHSVRSISALYNEGVFVEGGIAEDLILDIFRLLLSKYHDCEKSFQTSGNKVRHSGDTI
ncbi:hypothetical protein F5Y18DRAFT_279140 [Xylariaceae sp. FL1019]|nr:hypothetical protein F5Y18DRAFT_279140 [Xylariaceae sp. FL1019]